MDGSERGMLPDYLRPGLDIVSVGLNPSIAASRAGYCFAHPRNRFWPALNGSRLVAQPLAPGPAAVRYLFEHRGIGFTDVVRRPTRGAAQLRAADFREWAPVLADKLASLRPQIAWFHGRLAWEGFLRHALGARAGRRAWGRQPHALPGGCLGFVTPNPSPANAAYSLEDLVAWYDRLAELREQRAS